MIIYLEELVVDEADVKSRFGEALAQLWECDRLLLEYEVGERSVAAKLASYLAPLFPDHDVDVEYNRHGLDPKELELPAECRGGGTKLIISDVIVHQRGHDDDNVLVVEIKKATNRESRLCDRAKISAMKKYFYYAHGLLLEIPAGPGAKDMGLTMEWL